MIEKYDMAKVIFLDFDGVLNTERWHSQAIRGELKDEYGYRSLDSGVYSLRL
jgi:beta-phosphoglucomutase-like phosphatase (HAD superfamily)